LRGSGTTLIASTGTAISMSFWVKRTSNSAAWKMLARFSSDAAESGSPAFVQCYHETSYFPDGGVKMGNSYERVTTGTAISLDAWNHIVVRGAASGPASLYRNGSSLGSVGTLSSTLSENIDEIEILGAAGGTTIFVGGIAHVALWDKELTTGEIAELYNGGTASNGKSPASVATSNLKFYLYDSLTAHTGGVTLTSTGGTVSYSTSDPPPVDEPSGGSIVPQAMANYRMRAA
jgi:hypothetical protein